jgi:hypothetical protein
MDEFPVGIQGLFLVEPVTTKSFSQLEHLFASRTANGDGIDRLGIPLLSRECTKYPKARTISLQADA